MTGAPQDLAAEEATLGAMMFSEQAIESVLASGITRKMFQRPSHQHVFDAVLALHEREVVDELTVGNWLREKGLLASVGGMVALGTLVDRVPSIANVRAYADAVKDAAIRHGCYTVGVQLANLGMADTSVPGEIHDQARRLVDEMIEAVTRPNGAGVTTLADAMSRFYDDMAGRAEAGGRIAGLSTGLSALDERWGGLQPGRLYVVAGRPGMGKTALGMGMAESVAFGSGRHVLSFNFEMSVAEQGGRTIARAASLDLGRLSNTVPGVDEFQSAHDTMVRLHEAAQRFHMDESPTLTSADLCRRARKLDRQLKRDTGEGLGLILVDYLQKIKKQSGASEYDSITDSSSDLKALALELEVPVVALAQLNRGVESRDDKLPTLGDLRGSGAIEQDADLVGLLMRPEYYLKENTPPEMVGAAQIETAKSRVGVAGVDRLRWEGCHVRFSDYRPVFHVGGAA